MALELVTLPSAFGLRNVSPFCVKAEMLLASLGEPFTQTTIQDPRRAPKGKLPYLVDGESIVADSELIAVYLDERSGGRVFGDADRVRAARGLAFARLAEDHLYWLMVASRWLDDAWWPNVVDGFFGFVPALARGVASRLARRQVRRTLDLHGLGRHGLTEQQAFARRDLAALDAAVGSGAFLHGNAPGIHDFAVAGLIATIADQRPPTWMNPILDDFPALKEHAERVQAATGVWARFRDRAAETGDVPSGPCVKSGDSGARTRGADQGAGAQE